MLKRRRRKKCDAGLGANAGDTQAARPRRGRRRTRTSTSTRRAREAAVMQPRTQLSESQVMLESIPVPVIGAFRNRKWLPLVAICAAALLSVCGHSAAARSLTAADEHTHSGQFMSRAPGVGPRLFGTTQIVFPAGKRPTQPHYQLDNSRQQQQQQQQQHHHQQPPAVYVNPQPATSSRGRFLMITSAPALGNNYVEHDETDDVGSLVAANEPSRAAQVTSVFAAGRPNVIGSTPSSIGKHERHQVAEWPFFKSLQSARSSQLMNSQQQESRPAGTTALLMPHAADILRAAKLEGGAEALAASATGRPATLMSTTPTGTPALSSASTTTTPSTTTTTTTTTSTTTTTTSTSTSTTAEPTTSEPAEEMTTPTPTSTTTSSTTTSTTTTTTPPPATSATSAPPTQTLTTAAVGMARDQLEAAAPMFAPAAVHKSIQAALDRLVELGAASRSGAAKPEVVRLTRPATSGESGGGGGSGGSDGGASSGASSSSLSLNVLLKNFGAFNLTSLDQILLKSSWNSNKKRPTNESSSTSGSPLDPREQRIQINGLHSHRPAHLEGGDERPEVAAPASAAAGECKIEYTMEHVNISLANDERNDYTCDYIIDRKLAPPHRQGAPAADNAARACKLRLRSDFFRNDSATPTGAANSCALDTHLAIGGLRFCFRRPSAAGGAGADQPLDRLFEFPVDREAFDLRLVHKRRSSEPEVEGQPAEIRLEIRPVVDQSCAGGQLRPQQRGDRPAGGVNSDAREGASALGGGSPRVASSERPREPEQPGQPAHSSPIFHEASSGPTTPRPAASTPTPASQTFELSGGARRPAEELPLCSEHTSVHVSTIGQLTTPNYPANYSDGTRCRQLIKRVSAAYCRLLLHFRDFDLISTTTTTTTTGHRDGATAELCLEDYLQIGETRYCNRYAMIGHKMYLNFSELPPETLVEDTIALVFHSDAHRTGRGFLVKYQQLPCDAGITHLGPLAAATAAEAAASPASSLKSTARPLTVAAAGMSERPPRLQTLAPALQQPDFSLALKTAPPDRKQVARHQQPVDGRRTSGRQGDGARPPSGALQVAAATTTQSATRASPEQQSASSTTASITRRESEREPGVQCNQVNHEMSFLMASHQFPRPYANNLECVYYVRRNNSRVCYLELTFVKFDLEPDGDCRFDYLEINGVRLCGSLHDLGQHKISRIYLFEEPLKLIKFRSDALGTRNGFLIRADQLECAPNGSIVRTKPHEPSVTTTARQVHTGPAARAHSNSSSARMFEYDSSLVTAAGSGASSPGSLSWGPRNASEPLALVGRQRQSFDANDPGSTSAPPSSSSSSSSFGRPSTSGGCDDLFYGNEVTIRSPNWPESYTNDDSLNSCKYTIVRQLSAPPANDATPSAKLAVCQLELRFVHLRLGFGDCLEIGDGLEMLCGFNARNLVRYYPLGERQTHLTITFTTGAAKFAARAAFPSTSPQNHSDLLPSFRAPFRFMLIARQLECIDDFLAPQLDLESSARGATGGGGGGARASTTTGSVGATSGGEPVNATNLLYSSAGSSALLRGPADRKSTAGPRYANRTEAPFELDGRPASGATSSPAADGRLMYSFASSVTSANSTTRARRQQCLVQLTQYNGLLSAAQIFARLRQDELGELGQTAPLQQCEVRVQLLPGYCQLQLTFGEFQLTPARLLANSLCPGESLELAGVQYCGHELRNSSRLLSTTLPGQRHISLRATLASAHGFRAIFKQLECEAGGGGGGKPLVPLINGGGGGGGGESSGKVMSAPINLREIDVDEEFFELRSDQFSSNKFAYDPNSFLVFKLTRAHPNVCKVRLLFHTFQLEARAPGAGCRGDFLDINQGADRLCGSLDNFARDYDWAPQAGAFAISFVSDAHEQRAGFRIFGQQLHRDCPAPGDPRTSKPSPIAATTPTTSTTTEPPPTQPTRLPAEVSPTRSQESNGAQGRVGAGQLPANCSLVVEDLNFELASPKWPRAYDATGTCHYLIRRSQAAPDICSVTLRVNSLILDLEASAADAGAEGACSPSAAATNTDYLELDGPETRLCGLITRPRTFTFHFDGRHFIVAKFVSAAARGFGFHIEGQQNRCAPAPESAPPTAHKPNSDPPTRADDDQALVKFDEVGGAPARAPEAERRAGCSRLLTGQLNLLESEHFPEAYASNQNCVFAVRRLNESVCALDLVLDHFDLEQANEVSGLCESDYLEIDYSRFCGSYPSGHRLRFNYFDRELDKLLRFRSDAATQRGGFSLTVRQLMGADCVGVGGAGGGGGSRRRPASESLESGADSAGGASAGGQRELINYLPDSTGGAGSVRAESAANSSEGERLLSKQPSATLCQFVYHSERQVIVAPNYNQLRDHYEPNLDCEYKIMAANYDVCTLRLTFLDLDLEHSRDCLHDYLLIDSRRYCGSLTDAATNSSARRGHAPAPGLGAPIELEFGLNLPRELDLLFHTDAHASRGRGFKLLAEQLPCSGVGPPAATPATGTHSPTDSDVDTSTDTGVSGSQAHTDQEFKMAADAAESAVARARQTRRLRFGQVHYPHNYVSQSAGSSALPAAAAPATRPGDEPELRLNKEIAVVAGRPRGAIREHSSAAAAPISH